MVSSCRRNGPRPTGRTAAVALGCLALAAQGIAVSTAVQAAPAKARPSIRPSAVALPGVPGRPQAEVSGHGAVRLTWAHPTKVVAGYRVRVATKPTGPWKTPVGCTGLVKKPTCTAKSLLNGTTYYFKVASVASSRTSKFSATSKSVVLRCSNGSSCRVGDTGPGGGTVFYATTSAFDPAGDMYLEFAAPGAWYDWASSHGYLGAPGVIDPGLQWCAASPSPRTAVALGAGENSTRVLKLCATDKAAHAARGYNGGGKGDWSLPSKAEANLLCQYAAGVASPSPAAICAGSNAPRGGFSPDYYWTSSSTNLDGMLAALSAEVASVPCFTGQPALPASTCAGILATIAPAIAVSFAQTYVPGPTKASGACSGALSPLLVVPAAGGLPADTPHDGPRFFHCIRQVSPPVASPQVRPVRAFH